MGLRKEEERQMIRNQETEKIRRLEMKTLDEVFKRDLQYGMSCSPMVADAIVKLVKDIYFPLGDKDQIRPGKVSVAAIIADEPPGKPIRECQLRTIIVTLHDAEDDEYRKQHGISGLRRRQIVRMAEEAYEQGALLTLEDLAYRLLMCGMRTLNRDLKALRGQGVAVPLRGAQKDIGRSITHRKQIIESYLRGRTYTEIAYAWRHSEQAIRNYITTFARVGLLSRKGVPREDIAFLVQISVNLVIEYQLLLESYLAHPEYGRRAELTMSDLEARLTKAGAKKGGPR
jgi:hypothetical protein